MFMDFFPESKSLTDLFHFSTKQNYENHTISGKTKHLSIKEVVLFANENNNTNFLQ